MMRTRYLAALSAAAAISVATPAMVPARAAASTPDAATPVSTGHSAWAWGNPNPQGQNLAGVTFQGATGYAVGAFGTVLRSDDAGQTWTGLPSGTTDDLNLVQELSPTDVIVAGGCSALESTDAGATFTALPLGLGDPCQDPVAAVAFSDSEHGYIELQDGTLLYTADGGATLQAKSSPPLGGGDATGLAFSSPTTGLAISDSGLIERTTDGGNSWTQVEAAPAGLHGVTIVSPTLDYAVGGTGLLLASTDGGATWSARPLTLQGGGVEPLLTGITCADADDCLIATAASNELVRTTDGGLTGAEVSASNDALAGVAYATGSTVVGVGAQGATVISGDGGQTFPSVTPTALTGFTPEVIGLASLTAGAARGTAYLPGQGGIAATADSGRSWSLLRVPTNQPIQQVAFPTAQTGYALDTNGVLHRTTNGGVSWASFAGSHSEVSALVAPSPNTLLLVGPKGIMRSTDGGVSFREVPGHVHVAHGTGPRIASQHRDRAFAVHGTIVASNSGGGSATLIVSTDAGRTWRSVQLPPHNPHGDISVSALSASRLWFLERDVLWATMDGGRHWHTLPAIGHLGDTTEVSFSSSQDGVIGFNARLNSSLDPPLQEASVLRTTDGGRSWTPEILGGQNSASSADLLATPTGDLDVIRYGTGLVAGSAPLGFFTTAGAPAPTDHTSVSVRFAKRRMSARALAHAGDRVLITGHLSPVLSPDESVAISFRLGHADWRVAQVRVASNGSFQMRLGHVHKSAAVVAQVAGTSAIAGAGTPVARFSVTR